LLQIHSQPDVQFALAGSCDGLQGWHLLSFTLTRFVPAAQDGAVNPGMHEVSHGSQTGTLPMSELPVFM
jgi:hypothetical protein